MEGCLNVDDVVELLEESRKVERRVLGRLKEKVRTCWGLENSDSNTSSFDTTNDLLLVFSLPVASLLALRS